MTRTQFLYSVAHPCGVSSIALPTGSDGNVFATASDDCILRIFDIRCSTNGIYIVQRLIHIDNT